LKSLDSVAQSTLRKLKESKVSNRLLERISVIGFVFVFVASFIWVLVVTQAFAQAMAGSDWAPSVLQPLWTGTRMTGETLFFVQKPEDQNISARLMFVPTKIISVTSANGATTFDEGRDYVWKPSSDVLTLVANSRIPFKTWEQLHPPKASPHSLGESADGKSSLFFEEPGDVFQGLQVAVTYDHEEKWSGTIPQSAGKDLRRTIAKLQAKRLKLVIFGDSVSAGAGASGNFHAPPNQPSYTELVAVGLRARYGAEVTLQNLSEGGQDSTWAVKTASKAAAQEPDLVIVGFGGNDATRGISAQSFAQNIQTVIDTIRKSSPNADFILIATMTANPDWPESKAILCKQYRDALFGLAGPGVAVADEYSVWQGMLKNKKFLDLTANGINHPNDFGHRVYAQVVLQLLK
jgi:acyl-CoA thioesterase-1